jgi:hypothetical protein
MENKIRSIADLQHDVNILKDKEELMCRQRTELYNKINSIRNQISRLEELILDNSQHEMFENK